MMKSQIIAAAGLLLTIGAHGQDTISSGSGFGTYYYDLEKTQACNTDFSAANTGQVECSLTQAWTLENVNSNYLVAMNHTQLVSDMGKYCGKKVVVSVNGVASDLPLFIGDGCERCATGPSTSNSWNPGGAPGLDFSYSVLSELSSSACTDGHIDISWEIVDETLYDFDSSGSGIKQGPVNAPVPSVSVSLPTAPTTVASAATAEAPAPTSVASAPTSVAPAPVSTSVDTQVINPAKHTTLVTVARTATVEPVAPSDPPSAAAGTPTDNTPSGACPTGAWQCNGNVLEQCLTGAWAPRITCQAGNTCQGGATPYCAPPGYGQPASPASPTSS